MKLFGKGINDTAWRKKKKELLLRKEQEIRGIDERIFENLKNWLESESEF